MCRPQNYASYRRWGYDGHTTALVDEVRRYEFRDGVASRRRNIDKSGNGISIKTQKH